MGKKIDSREVALNSRNASTRLDKHLIPKLETMSGRIIGPIGLQGAERNPFYDHSTVKSLDLPLKQKSIR
jgi:hypothetical protein